MTWDYIQPMACSIKSLFIKTIMQCKHSNPQFVHLRNTNIPHVHFYFEKYSLENRCILVWDTNRLEATWKRSRALNWLHRIIWDILITKSTETLGKQKKISWHHCPWKRKALYTRQLLTFYSPAFNFFSVLFTRRHLEQLSTLPLSLSSSCNVIDSNFNADVLRF